MKESSGTRLKSDKVTLRFFLYIKHSLFNRVNLPVFGVSDGINDGVMDDRSFGNHSWYGVHEGC